MAVPDIVERMLDPGLSTIARLKLDPDEWQQIADYIKQLRNLACTAACQARDLGNGWHVRELCQPIDQTLDSLDALVPGHEVLRP